MKIAVLSDIHGNMEAFSKVLEDIDRFDTDRIVNLGDCIGYGPEPEEVISLIRRKNISNVVGNHELALYDKDCRELFNPDVLRGVDKSMEYLSRESLEYIEELPVRLVIENALFVHGCPMDSQTIYLNKLSKSEIVEVFAETPFDLNFVGHTHKLMAIGYDGVEIQFFPLVGSEFLLDRSLKYIVNVGSVGQPRDRDKLAKYVIWDSERNLLRIRRLEYDSATTASKIMERGFRKEDALRLFG